jgi:hypothetical protein
LNWKINNFNGSLSNSRSAYDLVLVRITYPLVKSHAAPLFRLADPQSASIAIDGFFHKSWPNRIARSQF